MKKIPLILSLLCLLAACQKEKADKKEPVIITASGDISAKMDEFRALLGGVLNTSPGQSSGRREINWDGVPDQYNAEKLPVDFFNPVEPGANTALQRGFVYDPVTDARISSDEFTGFEPANASEFSAFSGEKTFSAVSSNLWNVEFEVAGTRTDAFVNGFGAVFVDVDQQGSATIEFFSGTKSLGEFAVPARTSGPFSFLGVYFPNEKVTGLRIRQGDAAIAAGVKDISAGGTQDLVIMDDFIYSEPKSLH